MVSLSENHRKSFWHSGLSLLMPLSDETRLLTIFLLVTRMIIGLVLWTAAWVGFTTNGVAVSFPGQGYALASDWASLWACLQLLLAVMIFLGLGVRLAATFMAGLILVLVLLPGSSHGWFAVVPSPHHSPAQVLANIGLPAGQASIVNSVEANRRLETARRVLTTHANYRWITESGELVVHNRGIETSLLYTLLLLMLGVCSGGRISFDSWLAKRFATAISLNTTVPVKE